MTQDTAYQIPVVIPPTSDYLIQVGYAKASDLTRPFVSDTYSTVALPNGNHFRDTTNIHRMNSGLDNTQMQHLNDLLYFIARHYHQHITARVLKRRKLVVTGTQPLDTTSESIRNYKNGVGPVKEEQFSVPLSSIPTPVVETLTARNAPTTPAGLRDPLLAALLG